MQHMTAPHRSHARRIASQTRSPLQGYTGYVNPPGTSRRAATNLRRNAKKKTWKGRGESLSPPYARSKLVWKDRVLHELSKDGTMKPVPHIEAPLRYDGRSGRPLWK